jgi:hypothetical protein
MRLFSLALLSVLCPAGCSNFLAMKSVSPLPQGGKQYFDSADFTMNKGKAPNLPHKTPVAKPPAPSTTSPRDNKDQKALPPALSLTRFFFFFFFA